MQLRIYTAYAAMFSVPPMRPCFYAATHLYRLCGHSFVQSFHAVVLLRCHAFLCGRSLYTVTLLRSCVLYTAIFLYGHILMRLRYLCSHAFTLYWMEMVLRGTDLRAEVGSLGDGPAPVRRYGSVVPAGPLLSRQAEGDGTPAVFSTDGVHGALQLLLFFLLLGDHRGLQ